MERLHRHVTRSYVNTSMQASKERERSEDSQEHCHDYRELDCRAPVGHHHRDDYQKDQSYRLRIMYGTLPSEHRFAPYQLLALYGAELEWFTDKLGVHLQLGIMMNSATGLLLC